MLKAKSTIHFTKRVSLLVLFLYCTAVKAETTVINILVDDNYPPYSYVHNAQLKGVYVDLVREAAKTLLPEYIVRLEPMPWKRALIKIKQGEVFGILPPYKHFEERPYIGAYSSPLYTEKVVVICKKDTSLSQAFEPSANPEIPIALGLNSGYLVLNQKYKAAVERQSIKLYPNKSTEANLLKLVLGRIHCYVNDELTIIQGLKEIFQDTPGKVQDYIEMDVLSRQTAHIGYAKSHLEISRKKAFIPKMNQALEAIISTGFIEKKLR